MLGVSLPHPRCPHVDSWINTNTRLSPSSLPLFLFSLSTRKSSLFLSRKLRQTDTGRHSAARRCALRRVSLSLSRPMRESQILLSLRKIQATTRREKESSTRTSTSAKRKKTTNLHTTNCCVRWSDPAAVEIQPPTPPPSTLLNSTFLTLSGTRSWKKKRSLRSSLFLYKIRPASGHLQTFHKIKQDKKDLPRFIWNVRQQTNERLDRYR